MLRHLAIDYMNQYARKYSITLSGFTDNGNFPMVLELIQQMLNDASVSKAMEVSIVFYLLYAQSQCETNTSLLDEIFQKLVKKHNFPEKCEWV